MSQFAASEWDAPESPAVYRTSPTPTGSTVSYQPGVQMTTNVWEEMTEPGATAKTYRLACAAGDIWPATQGM